MKTTEIVNEGISAMEAKDWNRVNKYFSDDFTFSGAVPNPLNKSGWEKLHRALQNAFPDLKFNLRDVKQENDKVYAKVKLMGTHTNKLEIPFQGFPPLDPTNKKFTMPEEECEFSFKGDKISKMHVKPVPNGGVQGLYKQLGVDITGKIRSHV